MGKNWAIVVGINNYDNLQPLKYAKRDAEAMQAWFKEEANFNQVFLFTEDSPPIATNPPIPTQPTQGRFKRFLNAQFEEPLLKPEDNLWFFFAGHGKRFVDQDYLMFLDSDPTDHTTAISVDYVTQRLRRCGADNVVLLIDACRDEGDRSGLGVGMQEHRGVITFYSCTASQKSWEIDELQHGSFTYSLLEGLRLQGESNCATVERLDQHLRYRVPQLNTDYKKSIQNPALKAEPPHKMYYILLEQSARVKDVESLKYQASLAENRGKLSLAKQLWVRVLGVSRTDNEAIEAIERIAQRQVQAVKPTSETLSSVQPVALLRDRAAVSEPDVVTYTRLQDLLKAGHWKEADYETYLVMLKVGGRKEGDGIRYEEIRNLSCTDLLTIDNLWVTHSNGRFGFSVQKKIYLEVGGKRNGKFDEEAWEKFSDRVGWRVKERWIANDEVTFDTIAPMGHLPLMWWDKFNWEGFGKWVTILLSHIHENCNIMSQPDVFLAHNTQDKPQVRAIALALKQRNITYWLDEEQIPPGRSFQDEIQQAIPLVKSAVIFIGSQGLGRWQSWELKAFISKCVEKEIPVIPVLLPGVEKFPEELIFLREFRYISFSEQKEEEEVLDLIEWGITGRKPQKILQSNAQKPGQIPQEGSAEKIDGILYDKQTQNSEPQNHQLSEIGANGIELSPEAVQKLPLLKDVCDALIDAFPDKSSLEQMLYFELNKNLNVIAGGSNLKEIIFNLIRAAQSQGWLLELVSAARKSNPRNSRLLALDLQPRERKRDSVEVSKEKEDYTELSPEDVVKQITKAKPSWHQSSGNLDYRMGIIDCNNAANVRLCNFIVEAKFYNPYNGADIKWKYGFSFRETSSDLNHDPQRQRYNLWISSNDKILFLEGPNYRVEEKISNLDVSEKGFNKLRLFALKETAIVFINDLHIQNFDISELMIPGKVYLVSTGINDKSAKYEDFKLWQIPN
ncbi:GUN4 domain-containing protein [Nostoc sp. CHAB 5844]|nr:GUN4 domain-containing protein [Nostoc sp. CHAB 5844]